MTKAELLTKWRESAMFKSRDEAETALSTLCDIIAAELLGGGEVPLPGVGKLKVKDVPAKTARNPRTGEKIDVPARRKVVFVVRKELKDSLN